RSWVCTRPLAWCATPSARGLCAHRSDANYLLGTLIFMAIASTRPAASKLTVPGSGALDGGVPPMDALPVMPSVPYITASSPGTVYVRLLSGWLTLAQNF